MAEIYPLGENTIFYRTATNPEPEEVTADLLDPDLNNHVSIELTKVRDSDGYIVPGLYSFKPIFSKEGTYVAVFYEGIGEDKKFTISQSYSTRKIPAEGEFRIRRSSLGPNVIG